MKTLFPPIFLIALLLNIVPLATFGQEEIKKESKCVSGDCANGIGVYEFSNGMRYEGQFVEYQLTGIGKFTFTNGDVYEGGLIKSKLNGKGKYHYNNGSLYDGNYVDGNMNGYGVMTYSTGDSYEGNWLNDKRVGSGKMTWKDNIILSYEGDWSDDIPTGKGTIKYKNDSKYVGDVVNANREGQGIHYNSDGTVYFNGTWKDNQKVNGTEIKEKVVINNDKRASGDFCAVIKEVTTDAMNNFSSLKGDVLTSEGEVFKTETYKAKKELPGSTDSHLESLLGLSYYACYGKYEKLEDAEKEYSSVLAKLKTCFTTNIFKETGVVKKTMKCATFTKKYTDGYDTDGDNLYILNKDQYYEVLLRVSTKNFNRRVYFIKFNLGSGNSTFDVNLKEIMNAAKDNFSSVIGTKHEETNLFGKKIWYEINKSLTGVDDMKFVESSSMSSNSVEVFGKIYEGISETETKQNFELWAEKFKNALGSEYVFYKSTGTSGEYSEYCFAKKNETENEKTSVLKLVYSFYKGSQNPYSIKMKIQNIRFGGIL
jgi:hypothetical protein